MELVTFREKQNLTDEQILQLRGNKFIAVWRDEVGRERVMTNRCSDETAIYLMQLATHMLIEWMEDEG